MTAAGSSPRMARDVAEEFLYEDAALLDAWELDRWLTMFRNDARYEVPSTDAPEADSRTAQFLVSDSHAQLVARVRRLLSRNAHAENPRSRTVRLVSNVRCHDAADGLVEVSANFLIHRIRDGHVDPYVGRYEHLVAPESVAPRFVLRRAVIVQEALRPGGRISFVV